MFSLPCFDGIDECVTIKVHTEKLTFNPVSGIDLIKPGDLLHHRWIVWKDSCLAPCEVIGVAYLDVFCCLCGLCGDENDTESGSCSVDGRRGRVLENRDALYVLGV